MDFYFDENVNDSVIRALRELESNYQQHNILSTKAAFGTGIKDPLLFQLISAAEGILVTSDAKMLTRPHEFELLRNNQITAFIIVQRTGAPFWELCMNILAKWVVIKDMYNSNRHPFICEIKLKGKPQIKT